MVETVIGIAGMSCRHCVGTIAEVLKEMPGVKNATVSLEEKRARVEFDETKTSMKEIQKAVENAGYKVDEIKCKN